jgi:hypothetical protein
VPDGKLLTPEGSRDRATIPSESWRRRRKVAKPAPPLTAILEAGQSLGRSYKATKGEGQISAVAEGVNKAFPLELDPGHVSIRDCDVRDEMEREAVQKRPVRRVRGR